MNPVLPVANVRKSSHPNIKASRAVLPLIGLAFDGFAPRVVESPSVTSLYRSFDFGAHTVYCGATPTPVNGLLETQH
jgi:hypothetical protein